MNSIAIEAISDMGNAPQKTLMMMGESMRILGIMPESSLKEMRNDMHNLSTVPDGKIEMMAAEMRISISKWWEMMTATINRVMQVFDEFKIRKRIGGRGTSYECDRRLRAARHPRRRYKQIKA